MLARAPGKQAIEHRIGQQAQQFGHHPHLPGNDTVAHTSTLGRKGAVGKILRLHQKGHAAAGQDCLQRQGVPDVVIANAGISVGVDTALREDIATMCQVLATNTVGTAATFQPFITPMA